MNKMLKPLLFSISILFLIVSCVSQKTSLTLHNKSQHVIDSVFFPYNNKTIILNIKPGDIQKFLVDISDVKSYQDGTIGLYIYRSDKKILGSYFSYDEIGLNSEPKGSNLYIFDNGVQGIDKNLVEPEELELYFSKQSEVHPDSVTTMFLSAPQKCYKNFRDSTIYIKLPYKEFKENPKLNIYLNKKKFTITIQHDWDIWGSNSNQEIYYLFKDGITKRDETLNQPQR